MRLFVLFALILWGGLAMAENATVSDSVRANLRSGKTESYRVIRVLPGQTPVEILQVDQDYAKVRTAEADIGWLPKRLLTIHEEKNESHPEQNVLRVTQQELQDTQARLSRIESELEEERNQARTKALMQILVGIIALLLGVLLGVFLHEIYYRKRLNGLRI